jgi:hypothetical protein
MNNPAKKISERIFFAGLLLFAASLPLSMFMMSLSQFIIIGGWLLQGDISQSLKKAFANKAVWLLCSIYVLHIIGLAYTSDFNYAFNDLRIKLPLLLLPIILASSEPLTSNKLNTLLKVFISAVFVSTFISYLIYLDVIHKPFSDIRNISIFISHIRLSLFVCIAIYSSLWFFKTVSWFFKILIIAVILWFLFFLILIESITGLGILSVTLSIIGIVYIFRNSSITYKAITLLLILSAGFYTLHYIDKMWVRINTVNMNELQHLKKTTAEGNVYLHDAQRKESENGHLMWINLCEQEMRPAWNNRSSIPYDSLNRKGDELRMTIIRYLTSKGVSKDGAAINQLSNTEITAIENGVANADDISSKGISPRIRATLWEIYQYQHFNNPDGHSLAMRFEFWKTALKIISDHPLTGVGTGDVAQAFQQKYNDTNSPLSQPYRLRAHNQYLTIAVALGIPVLIWFIIILVWPGILLNRFNHFLYLSFWLTALLSMLTEDTLETQAGVSFFTFFNCVYLFMLRDRNK